jgi:hypothetical protein
VEEATDNLARPSLRAERTTFSKNQAKAYLLSRRKWNFVVSLIVIQGISAAISPIEPNRLKTTLSLDRHFVKVSMQAPFLQSIILRPMLLDCPSSDDLRHLSVARQLG